MTLAWTSPPITAIIPHHLGRAMPGSTSLWLILSLGLVALPVQLWAAEPVIVRDCPDCPEMIAVPIKAPAGPASVAPVLLVGRYEVSWKEYIAAIEQRGCPVPTVSSKKGSVPFDGDLASAKDDLSVTGLGVQGVECYLAWLTEKTGRRYRLPTVAEWVVFASAGATTRFPWGDDLGFNNAVVYTAYDRELCPTTPVFDKRFGTSHLRGCFAPNAFGLYDVIGNVGELTSDTKMMDTVKLALVMGGNGALWPDSSLTRVSQQILANYSDGLRVVAEPDWTAKAKR